MAKARADGEYGGSDFYIDEYWQFVVPDLDKRYPSFEAMQNAIDAAAKRIEAAKKAKINLPVITAGGKETSITGLHAGHGHAITKPKIDLGYSDAAYPNVPWIKQAILREAEMRRDAHHIELALGAVRFTAKSQGYCKSKEYDGTPEGLEKLYQQKKALAESTTLEELLKKTPKPKLNWLD